MGPFKPGFPALQRNRIHSKMVNACRHGERRGNGHRTFVTQFPCNCRLTTDYAHCSPHIPAAIASSAIGVLRERAAASGTQFDVGGRDRRAPASIILIALWQRAWDSGCPASRTRILASAATFSTPISIPCQPPSNVCFLWTVGRAPVVVDRLTERCIKREDPHLQTAQGCS